MQTWVQDHIGLSLDEAGLLVGVLSLVVPLVLLAFPPSRRAIARGARRLALVSGLVRRRYTRWFLRHHGTLRNIYLNRDEKLDLGGTYVSLSFHTPDDQENRVLATRILGETDNRRLVVVGEPGSGKSTLLRAFGTGILRRAGGRDGARDVSDLRAVVRSSEVPFFVPLRHFARHCDGGADSLRRYLVEEVVGRQAGVRQGARLFDRLCAKAQSLVLLDGLDEVPDADYERVRNAIAAFADDDTTGASRIVLSCRRQNFLRLRSDWVPSFVEQPHALAPLRDSEILRFLDKRRGEFTGDRSPAQFFTAIKASRSMELHRVPLILTISLGLYLHLAAYQIPSSVARFYDEMIRELLSRHDFRADSGVPKANVFNADDKYRFLREFALAMVRRGGRFEDFEFAEILAVADRLAPRMAHVPPENVREFVLEIIERSGLLTQTSDDDQYIFAHRSIQEFLAAVQLSKTPERSATELLRLAPDDNFRQVVVFFAAADDDFVDDFLTRLARRSVELAGHCLAVAGGVTVEVAAPILDELRRRVLGYEAPSIHVTALTAATASPKAPIRRHAVAALKDVVRQVVGNRQLLQQLAPDGEAVLQLLDVLAGADDPDFVPLVPLLAALLPDDEPRLVGPLWACLSVRRVEQDATTARAVVDRLLRAAVHPACFAELQAQPRYRPSFDTPELRHRAYPFERAVDPDSNLVTLLTWAAKLETPAWPNQFSPYLNRFMTAWRDQPAFVTIERDHFRRTKSFRPYPVMVVLSQGSLLAAVALAVWHGLRDGWRGLALGDLGPWSLPLHLTVPTACAFLAIYILNKRLDRTGGKGANYILEFADNLPSGLSRVLLWICVSSIVIGGSTPFSLAAAPLWNSSPVAYFVTVLACCVFLYWLAADRVCFSTRRVILRRPNEFEDVYDDPGSRLWLQPAV